MASEWSWKLLCEYDGSQPELYDLASDSGEASNFAAQHPDVVARLTAAVMAWNKTMPADQGPALAAKQAARKN